MTGDVYVFLGIFYFCFQLLQATLSAKVARQDQRMAEFEGQMKQADGNLVANLQQVSIYCK